MPRETKIAPIMRCNDFVEVRPYRDWQVAGGVNHQIVNRFAPDPRAKFAMQCVERWAMVAATPEGEDSAGRAMLRRLTPDELVEHAMNVSEKLCDAMSDRGWFVEIPSLEESKDFLKQVEDELEGSND